MRNYGSKHQIGAGIAAAVVLLLAILLPSVQIQDAMIMGSGRYSAKQVEEPLFIGRWGKDPAHAYSSDKFRPRIQIPFVGDYKVVFHNPLDVEVIIYERSIVEYVSHMNSLMYFDKDGVVVESLGSQLPGVPWITSMEFGRTVLYRPLPVGDKNTLEEILNLAQQLSVYDIAVDRIQYDSHGQTTPLIGVTEITMGGHTDIDGKISMFNDILEAQPQLTEISGTMKPDNYSESNSGAGIIFRKK